MGDSFYVIMEHIVHFFNYYGKEVISNGNTPFQHGLAELLLRNPATMLGVSSFKGFFELLEISRVNILAKIKETGFFKASLVKRFS